MHHLNRQQEEVNETTKCKNCKNGFTAGGFAKRKKREITILEKERSDEMSNVKEKDPAKKKVIQDAINNKYLPLLKEKENEKEKAKSKCLYCQGTGIKNDRKKI